MPEVVEIGGDGHRSMLYGNLVALTVAAIKDLIQVSDQHEAEQGKFRQVVADLKMENQILREKLRAEHEATQQVILKQGRQMAQILAWACRSQDRPSFCDSGAVNQQK